MMPLTAPTVEFADRSCFYFVSEENCIGVYGGYEDKSGARDSELYNGLAEESK